MYKKNPRRAAIFHFTRAYPTLLFFVFYFPSYNQDLVPWCDDYMNVPGYQELTFETLIEQIGEAEGIIQDFRPMSDQTNLVGADTFFTRQTGFINYRYRVYNPDTKSIELRYIMLVNEKQVLIGDDEFHDLVLDGGQVASFDIQVNANQEGTYDLLLIAVPSYQKGPLPGGDYNIITLRQSLIVVEPTSDIVNRNYVEVVANMTTDEHPSIHLALTLSDELLGWTYPDSRLTVPARSILNFNIVAGFVQGGDPQSSEQNIQRFALIGLIDYKQQNFSEDLSTGVLYRSVSPTVAYSIIPVQFSLDREPGEYDIIVVRIDNPGQRLCPHQIASPDIIAIKGQIAVRVGISAAETE